MQLPNWSRNLLLRRRRKRERSARQELFAPVRLSLRKLEQRRVLDVSAAFMNGVLEVDITNTGDVATVQDSGGNVSIRDASNNEVDVNGSGAPPVAWADVKGIVVRGDVAPDQEVIFANPLSLADGLQIEDSIESTTLTHSVNSGSSITLESDVILENDILLVGTDLTFGGTLDSQAHATGSLTIDAGAGTVSFNGDIGAVVPLRGLDIQRADGGVIFGDSLPVQMVNSTDFISIGSADAIAGTGVVFNAGTDATLQIMTTNDDVTINGGTQLRSNLSINTGSEGGDVIFTDASTIDSETGETNDLTLDAGEGSVIFHQNIGSTHAIGKLTVSNAEGGVTIGGTGLLTGVVVADGGIDIGAGANEIAGSGIVLNGGSGYFALLTDGEAIRLNGATTLASHVLFNTGPGGGDVTFTNDTPVDSELNEFNDLIFDLGAGSVFINEDLGRTNPLGSLTVRSARGGVIFGQATAEIPGSGGTGPVEIINTDRAIDIAAGNTNTAVRSVVFRGSAMAGSTVRTTGDDVRINGATTLGTDLTIKTDGGDLTFTQPSTIDGVAGATSSLSLDLGDGALFFNADIGRTTPLGRLTVVSARAGVTFGHTNAVNLVRTTQPIDIGAGTNVIEGGIKLAGGPDELLIATLNADVRLNGPILAQSDLAIDTGDGGGAITLTSNASIDSNDGPIRTTDVERNSVRLDAGAAAVFINANVGSQQRLGSFTIERAASGVVIGGAGSVTQIASDGPISIGSVAVIVGGIALEGGGNLLVIDTSADNIDFNGPTELRSDVSVNTGPGGGDLTLSMASTLNSELGEANNLSIALGTGNALLGATVGVINPLHELRIVSAMNVTAQQDVNSASIIQQAGSGSTIFEGPIDTTAATLAGLDLTGNKFVFNGPVMTTGDGGVSIVHSGLLDINPLANMRLEGAFNESGSGSVEIAADIVTSGDGIHFGSPVTLTDGAAADVLLDTTAAGNAAGAGIVFDDTVNAQQVGVESLTLNAGTSGDITFDAAVGGTSRVGQLRIIEANDLTLSGSLRTTNIAQDAGHGTTTFNGTVDANSTIAMSIDISSVNVSFLDAVTTTGDGGVSIVHSGLLDINSLANMRLEGAFNESGSGSVEIAADIVTSGDGIHFGSPVTLTDGAAADVLLDTTAAGNAAGAGIVFDDTVNAQQVGVESLTLNAGTSGDITFDAAVGGTSRVGQLRIIEANNLTLSGSLKTTNIVQDAGLGTTTFNGTVDASSEHAKGIDISTVNVSFLDAVTTTGDGRVELTATGVLDLAAAADMNLSGSFLEDGGGMVRTSADITTSEDDITFTDPVTLRASVRFDTGSGGGNLLLASTLDGTIDCQQGITLALGTGNALFQDAVGSSVGLGDLLIENAADVRFVSSLLANSIRQTAGSGETRFDGAVTIKSAAGVDLTTGSATINDALDTSAAAGPIRITVSDDIAVNSSVTAGSATVKLSADDDVLFGSNASITTSGADVTIRADADSTASGSGGAVLMTDGAFINAEAGVIDITADENIQLGRLATTTLVQLTSTSGAIVDGGDSGGADIVADRLAIFASTGVGAENPIDTSVNTIAIENTGAGGVRFENATGRPLTIGTVDGLIGTVDELAGIKNGPIELPAKLGGDVEVIHVGAINVENAILNHGGGHTIVRAELPGDLTINAPIQNRGGNGWIFLFSSGDLVINHSVPEPEAEISVENEGAIRGEAGGEVIIDNSETEYVIVRTHAERPPVTGPIPPLPPKFADPARYPPETDTAFYAELEAELRRIRELNSGQATNFAPIFDIEPVDQGGSDIDSNGRGIVKITIGDGVHLETNWHFTIDWGDGTIESYTIPGNPRASLTFLTAAGSNTNRFPDLTNTPRIDSGVGGEPGVYYVHHQYLRPPDPEEPAAPIPIFATLRYDAREEGEQALDLNRPDDGSGIFNGIRFFRNGTEPVLSTDEDALTNPGEGSFFFIKIIESVIIPVESRQVTFVYLTTNSPPTTAATGATFEFVVASFESEVFEEYRLFMKVVDDVVARARQSRSPVHLPHAGEVDQEYPLDIEYLDKPLSIFRESNFPNGHYRIYLEEVRTGRVRLILDVHIYEGRVVPENFREGAAERQPGSDDSSQINAASDPLADSVATEAKVATETDDGATANVRAAALKVGPEANANDDVAVPGRSRWLLPVAAAALPWRSRVRKALQSEERSISRASLRLRRH